MNVPRESRYITTVFCLRLLWDVIYDGWAKITSDRGLTVTEEQILWVIWLFNSSTVTEVARRLQRDKGTVSKCIYSLEENALIVREAGIDRRSYGFKITAEGEKIRQSLAGAHGAKSAFALVFRKLTEAEQCAFLTLLLKITEQIEGRAYMASVVSNLSRIGGEPRD